MTGYWRKSRHQAAAVLDGFWRDEGGTTAIEYALMAGSIGGVIVTTIYTLGDDVLNTYYGRLNEVIAAN